MAATPAPDGGYARPGWRLRPPRMAATPPGWRLRRPDGGEELFDFDLEMAALVRQRLGRGQHLRRCRAGFRCAAVDVGDVGGHPVGALRRLMDVARDRGGGDALLLD